MSYNFKICLQIINYKYAFLDYIKERKDVKKNLLDAIENSKRYNRILKSKIMVVVKENEEEHKISNSPIR